LSLCTTFAEGASELLVFLQHVERLEVWRSGGGAASACLAHFEVADLDDISRAQRAALRGGLAPCARVSYKLSIKDVIRKTTVTWALQSGTGEDIGLEASSKEHVAVSGQIPFAAVAAVIADDDNQTARRVDGRAFSFLPVSL
jgi:hypothetical protein